MACLVMPPPECLSAGFYGPIEPHQKRAAPTFNEIGNLIQASVQKKMRICLEPVPSLWGQQKATVQQQSTSSRQQPDLSQVLETARPAGRYQPSVAQAFYLLSDSELEYLQDCLAKELKSQPDHRYLHMTQSDIDAHKRLVLVDWLIEVVDEFQLSQETLFLSTSLLDRFLSQQEVPRCQLQLLGVTCLWVASKYEEVLPPSLLDFVEITDNSYTASDLVRMEAILLEQLRYKLAVPTQLFFLHQLLSHAQLESGCASSHGPCHPIGQDQARLVHLAEYLLELALLTPDTLQYRPSIVAASALQLAANLLAASCKPCSRAACSSLCRAISGAAATKLDDCMCELQRMHCWAGSAQQPPCVKDKYNNGRRSYVASIRMWAA